MLRLGSSAWSAARFFERKKKRAASRSGQGAHNLLVSGQRHTRHISHQIPDCWLTLPQVKRVAAIDPGRLRNRPDIPQVMTAYHCLVLGLRVWHCRCSLCLPACTVVTVRNNSNLRASLCQMLLPAWIHGL